MRLADRMRERSQVALFLALLALAVPSGAGAKPPVEEAIEKAFGGGGEEKEDLQAPDVPIDELGRGVPLTSVAEFMKAAEGRNYQRASEYLDLRRIPAEERAERGPELARQLQIVFEPTLWIDLDLLSDQPEGHAQDGLPVYRDRVGSIETLDGKVVNVLLQRVPRGDGVDVWKFAAPTVAKIPMLYRQYGYGVLDEIAPRFMLDIKVAGAPLLEWLVVLGVAALAFLAAYLITSVLVLLLYRWRTPRADLLKKGLAGPLRLAIWLPIVGAVTSQSGFSMYPRAVLYASQQAIVIVVVAWAAVGLVDFLAHVVTERLRRAGRIGAISLLPPGRKTAKALVFLIAGIAILQSFGFNVTALLAGLGVGGVAVALAAQKTIENFIAGVTLYADRPVRLGDFCRFGNNMGTVEEIGLRSTQVRTLDRTILAIPNADFASMALDNLSKRDRIWYHPRIPVRSETTPDQIRCILVEVREMLYAHPKVSPEGARIRFVGFGTYSLDLDVFAYVDVTDYAEFLEIAEDLNLHVMDIVQRAGSKLAVPAQTTFVESGREPDAELAAGAAAKVAQWRQQEKLYIPRFPEERIQELRDTLRYPPEGAPVVI